jgi:glycolate oxidase FAD binding subunit
MSATLSVAGVEELQQTVASCPQARRLLPIAGASKPPLSRTNRDDVDLVDVSALRGIVEYDPRELTVTAMAATPVAEVANALAEHRQYLPFDPPLLQSGATLGGVVAAGASGPNALRHGTIRDFVIGVSFVDGTGRLISSGGKVVKNAAGFDLSKLMVGSLGRLGVITRLSLKVFPKPRAAMTLEFACHSTGAALRTVCRLSSGARHLDAADVLPGGRVLVRIGGDAETLDRRCNGIVADGLTDEPVATYRGTDDQTIWAEAAELAWAGPDETTLRVPLTASQGVRLEQAVVGLGGSLRFSLAANVAWATCPYAVSLAELGDALESLKLTAVAARGRPGVGLIGASVRNAFGDRIRAALDPFDRFVEV